MCTVSFKKKTVVIFHKIYVSMFASLKKNIILYYIIIIILKVK